MANLQITIDDGPQPVTNALIPILAELSRRNLTAAFFNIGQEVRATPSGTVRIRDEGHVLGNHSWNHLKPDASNYRDEQIIEQFQRTHDQVKATTRQIMKHWRAPRLDKIPRLTGLLVGSGKLYQLSHCDAHADSKDTSGALSATDMLTVLRDTIREQLTRNTFRLLFHVQTETARALPDVLDGLVADGHRLIDFSQTR